MAKTWDPFEDILKLQSTINEKIGIAFSNYKRPHSHISHRDNKIEVEVKLPGMEKSDVKLNISPRAITVQAGKVKKIKNPYYKKEEINNYFRKIVLSPGLDIKKAKANISYGTINITNPKKKK